MSRSTVESSSALRQSLVELVFHDKCKSFSVALLQPFKTSSSSGGFVSEELAVELHSQVAADGVKSKVSGVARFRERVFQVIQQRRHASTLTAILSTFTTMLEDEQQEGGTWFAPRDRSYEADAEASWDRQQNRKKFWDKYRINSVSQQLPVVVHQGPTVVPSMLQSMLETQGKFWTGSGPARPPPPRVVEQPRPPLKIDEGRFTHKAVVKWAQSADRETYMDGPRWPLGRHFVDFVDQDPMGVEMIQAHCNPKALIQMDNDRDFASSFVGDRIGTNKGPSSLGKSSSLPSISPNAPRAKQPPKRGAAKPERLGRGVLPPLEARTFQAAWQAEAPPVQATPTDRYLQVCQRCNVLPKPFDFVTGNSVSLVAIDQALSDQDLLAVAAMVRSTSMLEEVDLAENALLTDKSMVPFLQKLFKEPASSSLRRLCLRRCIKVGSASLKLVASLLVDPNGVYNLLHLDLSAIPISARSHLEVAKAVKNHYSLESLNLADTGLGTFPATARQCLDEILSTRTLTSLDLSWNCLTMELFIHLGQVQVKEQRLTTLRLVNCAASVESCDNAALPFLEQLAKDQCLQCLDISLNRLDSRAGLVFEDSLVCHPTLKVLDVSHNPLGLNGMSSLVRLFTATTCKLLSIKCADCFVISGNTGERAFTPSAPEGQYSLNLSRPSNRALLRHLYKCADRLKLKPQQALNVLNYSEGTYNHPTKPDSCGVWSVPTFGQLELQFSSMEAWQPDLPELRRNAGQLLEKYFSQVRCQLPTGKVLPFFSQFSREQDHAYLLMVLARDFSLEYCHFEVLCSRRFSAATTVSSLLPCVRGGSCSHYIGMLLSPTTNDFHYCRRNLLAFLSFTPENPSWHYHLKLENPSERVVMERLLVLDQWEMMAARNHQLVDVSQLGNGTHMRNIKYEHMRLLSTQPVDWELPTSGTLEFDYSTDMRPEAHASALSDEAFQKIWNTVLQSPANSQQRVSAIRAVSPYCSFTCEQVRELLVLITNRADRIAVFPCCFFRIVDIQNEKLVRVRFSLSEVEDLRSRIGHAVWFPFMQPEKEKIKLDFMVNDQRLATNLFVLLTIKENTFIPDGEIEREDGSKEVLTMGVPRSWQALSSIPTKGVFLGTYTVGTEARSLGGRRGLLQTFGRWQLEGSDQEVEESMKWSSSLIDIPHDVIAVMQVLKQSYGSLSDAFLQVKGEKESGGEKVMNMREFEGLVGGLLSQRLRGKEEKAVETVFRYLDSSGKGEVNAKGWAVLDELWVELELQTRDLLTAIRSRFENLGEAWAKFDRRSSGKLNFEDWRVGLEEVGFFGSVETMFKAFDIQQSGVISQDQFFSLQTGRSRRRRALVSEVNFSPSASLGKDLQNAKTKKSSGKG